MKVLHFYKTYYPESYGGVEQVIYQLATKLPDYGVSADVLSLAPDDSISAVKINNHIAYKSHEDFIIASTGFSISAIWKLIKLSKNYDVINYHFPWPYMDLVHFLAHIKIPTVVTYHSDVVRQKWLFILYKPLMNLFMRSVTKIVATSPNYFASSNVLQNFKKKVEVIPLGIDESNYPYASDECVDSWKNIVGDRFFLFVGVLRYYKGLNILLQTLAKSDFPTVIVGSGPMESELKKKASALGLKNLKFLGKLSDEDKVALIKLSLAMVFPSHLRSEAFGVSLLEGAMFGKPLISCEIGTGTSFVNEHGVTGFVVRPGDEKALEDAMQILWVDDELAKYMGGKARQRYMEHFTADQMSKRYACLYQRICS